MADTLSQHPALNDIAQRTKSAAGLFATDLKHMSHETLALSPGGKARTGYDIAYEVIGLHRLICDVAAGRTPKPMPDGWVTAPSEFKDVNTAIHEFESSVEQLLAFMATATDELLGKVSPTPFGEMPLMGLCQIVPIHLMYHSGQLNYIQTLQGDDQFHWF